VIKWLKKLFSNDAIKLLELYKEKIQKLENDNLNRFVFVKIPTSDDEEAYKIKLSELSIDPLYLFWMNKLQYHAVSEFQKGGVESPDYYRGMIAMITMIQDQSRKARDSLPRIEEE
jgi:hypothetical protein